jgi:FKBP-type peptidyl-prolyl cis-trans isomerase FklB
MRLPFVALIIAISAGLALDAQAQDAKAPPPAVLPDALKDPAAQLGYAIGLNLGAGLRRDAVTVDPRMVAQGVEDGLSGAKPRMTEDQIRAAVTQAQSGVQSRRRDAAAQAASTNAAEGAAFLKANAAKPGVVTLPSGLQYQILTPGTGPKPKLEDEVVCNYRGTLISGKVFDSSYDRGEPASFQVGGVIKGWTEALQLMPVGSKWRLFVPAALAYGAQGAGEGDIGPNATLIFEVELLSIKPKA